MMSVFSNLLPLPSSPHGGKNLATILVLPACFLAAALILRESAGPFWMWHRIDPDYSYLIDALKILNLTTPGHVDHPGTPVQWLGALVLKASYLTSSSSHIIDTVLADPEPHMHRITLVITWLNAGILLLAGLAGLAVFHSILPALMVQAAPFISTQILKYGIALKPESLLIFSVMALVIVTLLALRPGAMETNRRGFAIAFGVALGFGVACKITFSPLFVLPLFLLGQRKAIFTFAVASLFAFLLFTLPALGAYEQFTDWIVGLFLGSEHHGAGPATIINAENYPRNIYRLFTRPLFGITFILAVLTLVAVRRRGEEIPGPELKVLKGVALAQTVMVLMVAKQLSSHYMIPAYMLTALSGALLYRIVPALRLGGALTRQRFGHIFPVLLALIAIAQAFGVVKMDRQFREMREMALSVDNERFSACARIYSYSASSLSFALYDGDFQCKFPFSEQLKQLQPENDFWINIFTSASPSGDLRDGAGPRDLRQVLSSYPCAVFRGSRRGALTAFLAAEAPEAVYDTSCSTRQEEVFTMGVDCQGSLTGDNGDGMP
jgi:hypothetical protein